MEEGWVGVLNVRQQHVCQLRTLFHLEQISVWTNLTMLSHIMRIKNKIDDDEEGRPRSLPTNYEDCCYTPTNYLQYPNNSTSTWWNILCMHMTFLL
ncbi:hypothetical protein MtrunA17_Chr5g0398501 [Medicago truncatula]|uniref:Transmembrane protein n=1 Tax=Medicago truncatula TaxID=3880 RepID=A0A396HML2_MEDTR|nr:hypothetical protein MtrunA17_Chr5g0398501 [Medicago truncatula]